MSKGPTDFNDMAAIKGLAVVGDYLRAAVANPADHAPANDSPTPPLQSNADILNPPETSPVPSETVRPDISILLNRYSLAMPDAKVWDAHSKKLLKQAAFKAYLGAAQFAEWLGHEKRRTVQLADVLPQMAAAAAQGGGGLSTALMRYVYLNPSADAWDCDKREVVALSNLKYAIADCFDTWLKHPQRREIVKSNLVFDPTQTVDADTHINMFKGLPLEPDTDESKCENIKAMMWQLCNGDVEAFNWLRCWLAYPLQHVGSKMATAVLMHSDVHGSGKSYFFDAVMRDIYGEYCRTFGQQQLESQYNDWISQTLFGVFEEVLSRSQRYSHTGTVKQMITGKSFRVEKKYLSGWEEANHMNCAFLSNEVQPLPVEPSDRRFLVIWPESKLLDELKTGVDDELKTGGGAAFYAYLLATDTSRFSPYTEPPMTEAKKRIIEFGLPAWEVFYSEWKNGELDVPYSSCLVNDLFKNFERWCRQAKEHCMGRNRFSGLIASKERRQRDVHYRVKGGSDKKGVFFLLDDFPEGRSQEDWLGACVEKFAELERKHLTDEA